MKRQMWLLDFDEKLLPTPRRLEWESQCDLAFLARRCSVGA
jgi:hypothetical protein